MEIDWSKAPEWAQAHGRCGHKNYWISEQQYASVTRPDKTTICTGIFGSASFSNIVKRPTAQQWPETDERMTVIAQNGNTGEHYEEAVPFVEWGKVDMGHYEPAHPKTAVEFLNACAAVQSERGKQYDASGTGERSFAAAASAFNAATGKSLTGSDVCLLLTMVKLVRQYSSPDRLHHDSLLDGVSYLSLWAEELTKELQGEK
jgi:hypothetical protein